MAVLDRLEAAFTEREEAGRKFGEAVGLL